MEFAIARGFDLEPLADRARELAFSTVDLAVSRVRSGPVEVLATRPALRDPDGTVSLFSGYASFDGELVHRLLEPSGQAIRRVVDKAFAGGEPDGGLYAAARIDARGAGRVQVDPLGQYPLYYLRRGRDFVVSNNPHFVDAAVRSNGPGLTRSVIPAIDNLVYGGPLSGATMFEEVRWLLVGESLRFDDRGLEVVDRYPEQVAEVSERSVDELVAELVDAMHRHVISVADAAPDAISVADITGGADSRAVLAVVTLSGAFPDLTGRCITRYPNPDANAAGAVMEHLGLEPGSYPVVGHRDRIGAQLAAVAQSAHDHGGARDSLTRFPFAMPDLVHFTGQFGGGLAGASPGGDFMAAADPADAPRFSGPIDLLLQRRADSGAIGLVTAQAVAEFRERLRAEMLHLAALGVSGGHMAAEIYLRSRSKSHCGLSNRDRNMSLVRPDVHASANLVRLRRRLPANALHAKQAMFAITLRARPALAFAPMVKPWSEGVVPPQHRDQQAAMQAIDRETPALSRFDGPLWRPIPLRGVGDWARDAASAHREGPTRAEFAQAPTVVGNQAFLERVLEHTTAEHPLWEHYDRGAVERVVRRAPSDFHRSVEAGALGRVATGMAWMLGMESHASVGGRLSMRKLCKDATPSRWRTWLQRLGRRRPRSGGRR